MSNIKTFFVAFYDLNKRDLWFLIFVTILMGVVINLYPFNLFVKAGIIIVTAGYIFNFMRSATVLPSVSSDFDRYSWKYFQGLPLNKRELLISLVATDLVVMTPALVWFASFYKQLAALFTDSATVDLVLAIKIFLCLVLILTGISLSAIKNNITFPRKQYSKVNPRIAFFASIKKLAITATVLLYAGIALYYGSDYITWDPRPLLRWIWKHTPTFSSWYFVPLLAIGVLHSYYSTLKTWQDEKSSYIKINWEPKRDFSIIGLCLVLFWAPITRYDFTTPEEFRGSELIGHIYSGNLGKLQGLVRNGADINKPNPFGHTPIMAAARVGDYSNFIFLLEKGAKLEGQTKLTGNPELAGLTIFLAAIKGGNPAIVRELLSKGYSPNEMNIVNKQYAIHSAARRCNTRILDMLIVNKADLNVLNKSKQTALHLAARYKCFSGVALLLDAGINPSLKDKFSKTALQYVNNKHGESDLAYYLEKRTRIPAGK